MAEDARFMIEPEDVAERFAEVDCECFAGFACADADREDVVVEFVGGGDETSEEAGALGEDFGGEVFAHGD